MNTTIVASRRSSILNSLSDFWLLGGLSILMCAVMHFVNYFRDGNETFELRFMQVGALFSVLSILCNHPHFLISYRFGYGRGFRFIREHWFALVAVPIALIVSYGVAFSYYNSVIPESAWMTFINTTLAQIGIGFSFGQSGKIGEEIVGLTIWLMYLTVGWHYCKQVYGCMMVYAYYDGYKLKSWQKEVFKWSAISIAFYQFMYMTTLMGDNPQFQGFHMSPVSLPGWMNAAAIALLILTAVAAITIIFQVHKNTKAWPSIHFLTPWIAFYVWWIPIGRVPEYYLLMVPFFHSLQYLPFAFRLESGKIRSSKWFNLEVSIKIIALLSVGFLSFEFIPTLLDKTLETSTYQSSWFFLTAIPVFINIHHFFIDSVIWKFKDEGMESLLVDKVTILTPISIVPEDRVALHTH